MLGFGGAGGLINMSYQLDTSVHNTQWITGHFHLIFGGAIVIMYFAIAYDLWPHLTGRALESFGLMRAQLWLWFVGMIVTTFPWHYVGILGMPRRMAFYDYANPAIVAAGVFGDDVGDRRLHPAHLGLLFLIVLIARPVRHWRGKRALIASACRCICRRTSRSRSTLRLVAGADDRPHRGQLRLSRSRNLMALKDTSVPAVYVGAAR